jgi:rifampicin phosphotransferase
LAWRSPDGSEWWLDPAHFPDPVSRLYVDVINTAFEGRIVGETRWGIEARRTVAAQVNGYLYFLADPPVVASADEGLFERRRGDRWWIHEAEQWFEVERPAVVAMNYALQRVEPASLDDEALAVHVRAAADHLFTVAPLHFKHRGRRVVIDFLRERAKEEGIDPVAITDALGGGSPASSRPAYLIAGIATALRTSNVDPSRIRSLDDVGASALAKARLDEYLAEFGHRLLDSYDLAQPTLHERPEVVIASIRAAATARPEPDRHLPTMSKELRQLLAEARISYGIEDDDDGICMFWPSGLLRRALLELGRRLGLHDPAQIFEVNRVELAELLDGNGPSHDMLAERSTARAEATTLDPPKKIGGDAAHEADTPHSGSELRGEGVGTGVARGRACVVLRGEGLAGIEPGDVLIAVTTTPGFNAVMPIVAAVATEARMGHTIICARELGLPGVVGVRGLLDAVPNHSLVEVDASKGTVRVIAPPEP